MKTLILLLLVSVSANASVWLTNGVEPTFIHFFGDVTGDGLADITHYDSCFINTGDSANPSFEWYAFITTTATGYCSISRVRRSKYLIACQDVGCCVSNCLFAVLTNCAIGINHHGQDLTGDGYLDGYYYHGVHLAFVKGIGVSEFTPFSLSAELTGAILKDEHGDFLPPSHYFWIVDVDADGFYELILNSSHVLIPARAYQILTPTNILSAGLTKNVQCFGDWDGDGIEDFMYQDGEVVLGIIPEPFIRHIPLIATVIFCRLKSCKTLF